MEDYRTIFIFLSTYRGNSWKLHRALKKGYFMQVVLHYRESWKRRGVSILNRVQKGYSSPLWRILKILNTIYILQVIRNSGNKKGCNIMQPWKPRMLLPLITLCFARQWSFYDLFFSDLDNNTCSHVEIVWILFLLFVQNVTHF